MILKLKPAFKDYIWGGTKLRDDFGFKSDLKKIAEGWMLSCHKDGENIIDGGKFDGKTLSEVIKETGKDILGTKAQKYDFFPILIKLIDAKDNLSVQVHPNDDYALRVEGEYGKTECWYVIDCDEGAELIYGFKKKISNEEFRKRIEDNTFLDVVNHVKVKKGEFFFIESGTLHAIGKGILLAEIQQNSNTTYRVYDYNRLGADGKPRELHTEKALDVTKCEPPKNNGVMPPVVKKDGYDEKHLTSCELFSVKDITVNKSYSSVSDSNSFVSILVIDGNGSLICENETFPLCKGDSYFISADSGEFKICGNVNLIETRV